MKEARIEICRRNHLFDVVPCSNWAVVCDKSSMQAANMMVRDLQKASMGFGFKLDNPREYKELANSSSGTYVEGIRDVK